MLLRNYAAACGMAVLVSTTALAASPAAAQSVPDSYPESYSETIANGTAEGKLLIYSSTDSENVVSLIDGFKARYPGIEVDFLDVSSNDVFTRISSEQAAGVETADLAWAGAATISSMINLGLSESYETPEKDHVIDSAIWQGMAFGITIEPIVMIYNKRLVDQTKLPKTHAELTVLLKSEIGPNEFATYDPARSAAGIGYGMTDEEQGADAYWALVGAIGKSGASLYSSTSTMVEKVMSGEHRMAYNLGGSTAAAAVMANPDTLGLVNFCDYSPHLVRVMMIPEGAAHKNAAKLFLDYSLSPEGQTILTKTPFGSVRDDVPSEEILAMPEGCEDARLLMPAGESALRPFDEEERTEFLEAWQAAFEGK